jgi:hypothetical protein
LASYEFAAAPERVVGDAARESEARSVEIRLVYPPIFAPEGSR